MGKPARKRLLKIDTFGFQPGDRLGWKYEVVEQIGSGLEGEVYLIRERETGIERAAKFFFPQRNINNKLLRFHAKKLHKLRYCPLLIQYHTQESFFFQGELIPFLVSEYVEGELLSQFIARQPGGRIGGFQALHLLHALAKGLESIHRLREYHGDLHTDNIIVRRTGLGFDLKILDFFHWRDLPSENVHDDVVFMIRLFHEVIGGKRHYLRQPNEVKAICCGLRRELILEKFRTAGQLKHYLENMEWSRPKRRR